MNGASKILTVSYGTFSCTLEGFDDPFNTMKAIAEYFRDLAADDRYFGAEPPTPDAAMLHRIAEREIQRRVESKIQDNGVILRAETAPMPRVTMPAVSAQPAPLTTIIPSVSAATEPAVESAAARLSRLRAAQTQILNPTPVRAPIVTAVEDIASRFDDRQIYAEDQDAEPVALAPVAPAAIAPAIVEPVVVESVAVEPAIVEPAIVEPIAVEATVVEPVTSLAQPVVEAAAQPLVEEIVAVEPEPVAELERATEVAFSLPETAPAMDEVPQPVADLPLEAVAEDAPALIAHSSEPLADAVPEPAPVDVTAAEAFVETAELPQPVDEAPAPAMDNIMASLRETLAGMNVQDDQLTDDMAEAMPTAEPEIDLSSIADQIGNDDLILSALEQATDPVLDAGLPQDMPAEIADLDWAEMDAPADTSQEELVALTEIMAEPQAETAVEMDRAEGAQIETAAFAATEPAPAEVAEFEIAPVEAEPVEAAPTEVSQADAEQIDADVPAAAEVTVPADAPVVAEKLQRARARVIKIRRLDTVPAGLPAADVMPAVTEAEAALPDDMPQPIAAEPQPILPALTAEAEAELESELAALAAEIGPVTPAEPSVEDALDVALAADLATVPPAPEKVDAKVSVPVADEAAVDRILAQTNTQLEVPETKRRRSAIAHLKAAVMATVAERRINPNANKSDAQVKMDPYRQDLNQVVRPGQATAPAPERERPAPLVLVSAQRIDRPRDLAADAQRPVPQIVPNTAPAQPVQPVRPRRVTSTGGSTTGSSSLAHAVAPQRIDDTADDLTADDLDQVFAAEGKQSFTDFAESLGATSLPELMEAAGAYCTLILDIPSFTRPQLFRQMQQIPELADMSREDSLRGFGKLLRDGRIQKSVRGQFVLSEKSPLLHEAKKIAG